jgi:gamma-glutamyltranspeptidase/glutathione hydrolase
MNALRIIFPILVCCTVGCLHRATPQSDHYVESHNGVVVSVSEPASDLGVEILKQGGNAVDAAIATAFALQVTYPLAGNIGGGGFMLVYPGDGKTDPVVFDYREAAPAAAYANMFTKEESQYTHKCVVIPGTVRGLAMAHKRFGTLPWAKLIAPAIKLARDGFAIDAHLAKSSNETLAEFKDFAELQRVYGKPGGGPWQPGDRLVQPDLARTLQILADSGPDAFYTGEIAHEIIAEMKRGNGLITQTDLANYQAIERKPLATRYRGEFDVYVPPPPCSGGVVLLEELNILNNFDLTTHGRWSAETIHLMAETMRLANCDRARYLGDPAFVATPPHLTTQTYADQLAKSIDIDRPTPSKSLAPEIKTRPISLSLIVTAWRSRTRIRSNAAGVPALS